MSFAVCARGQLLQQYSQQAGGRPGDWQGRGVAIP
jgi:hypothetical protein